MPFANQKNLIKLAFALRVDINAFLHSADGTNPEKIDETALLELHENLVYFLRKAFGLSEDAVQRLLRSGSHEVEVPAVTAPTASVFRPCLSRSLPSQDCESLYGACSGFSFGFSTPRIPSPGPVPSLGTLPGVVPSIPASVYTLAQFESTSQNHGLWISSAPTTFTCALLSHHIFGGPLESLESYPNKPHSTPGHGISINFLHSRDAASYHAFSRTPLGQLRAPISVAGCPNTHIKLTVRWNPYPRSTKPDVRLAAAAPECARRVLVFRGYSDGCGLALAKRICEVARRQHVYCVVERVEVVEGGAVVVVFSKIDTAIAVKGWHGKRLLGPEAAGGRCEVVFGRDPCDRPIPGAAREMVVGLRR